MADDRIRFYGAAWCGDCRRAKKFLSAHKIPYEWIDIDGSEDAARKVEEINDGKRRIPTLVFDDGSVLSNPGNVELAEKLGMKTEPSEKCYDLIVVGGGPAGLTAALYGARDGYDVLVLESSAFGGQAFVTDRLDNFPGFPDGIAGSELAERLRRQCERFGVELVQPVEVAGIVREGGLFVQTAKKERYGGRAVVIATGSTYKRLNLEGEDDLIGAGIHYCATCDGPFYKGKKVAVVGGGNSAGEESLFLSGLAEKVTLIVRGEELQASKAILEKIEESENVEVLTKTEVTGVKGEKELEGLVLEAGENGEKKEIDVEGLFIFIGLSPNADWLPDSIDRNEKGFVKTGQNLETSMEGVFAAGDVRAGSTKQAASAAGEGATAALMAREYMRSH